MGIVDWFKKYKVSHNMTRYKELGAYNAVFSSFGSNIYKSDLVRSCIRPISEHTSKAYAKCTDKKLERILNTMPNMYMTGVDFLKKVRNRLEIYNNVFIMIMRDDKGHACGFYPVPYSYFDAWEYDSRIYIKFHFANGTETVIPWDDLAVMRKDYNSSDIAGDSNEAILQQLELINTTNQGVAHAVKATANLRGILKNTKAMLSPEDVRTQKEEFVRDYMSLENEGGIASLDATQEFTPIKMEPTVADAKTMQEFRENLYRYFGVNDNIVMSTYSEEQLEAFYGARIEPFLAALSEELTRKCFTSRELGYGAYIIYESNRMQFASMKTKISVFKEVVQYGGMTVNEWRRGCNMEPVEGGDKLIRRLDAAVVDDEEGNNNGNQTE